MGGLTTRRFDNNEVYSM